MMWREAVRIGQFEPTVDSVATVRSIVDAHLRGIPAACRDTVVQVASELAANAVAHAQTPYEVVLSVGDPARIEVTDHSTTGPRLRLVTPDPERHGLPLVTDLASRWGVNWFDDHKVIWAEVATHRSAMTSDLGQDG
jgi:hypothetical protein